MNRADEQRCIALDGVGCRIPDSDSASPDGDGHSSRRSHAACKSQPYEANLLWSSTSQHHTDQATSPPALCRPPGDFGLHVSSLEVPTQSSVRSTGKILRAQPQNGKRCKAITQLQSEGLPRSLEPKRCGCMPPSVSSTIHSQRDSPSKNPIAVRHWRGGR